MKFRKNFIIESTIYDHVKLDFCQNCYPNRKIPFCNFTCEIMQSHTYQATGFAIKSTKK